MKPGSDGARPRPTRTALRGAAVTAGAAAATRRQPLRMASRDKYERIVEAAARLLDDYKVADISINQIAVAADISRTTIYNFFSCTDEIYAVVAKKYMAEAADALRQGIEKLAPKDPYSLIDAMMDCATDYYNRVASARKTLLSTGLFELALIEKDHDIISAKLYRSFHRDDWPAWPVEPLSEQDPYRTVELIQLAILTASVQRHEKITPFATEQAKLAGKHYLEGYLQSIGIPTSIALAPGNG